MLADVLAATVEAPEVAPAPRTAARAAPFEPGPVLAALPGAVVVVDAEARFRFANPEAEAFFQLSAGTLRQLRLADLLPPDNPLFALIAQVRATQASVSDYGLTLESPRLHRSGVAVHGAPLLEEAGAVVLMLQDASTARKLDRSLDARNVARSVTGMAAMLAHEVKNPLSGIKGAAQLLEQSVGEGERALTQLICDEADRINALVDRMEIFSERPIERQAVNIHQVLDHVRRIAQSGFARHVRFLEHYDPSLPPVLGNRDQLVQVVLNLVKNAAEAVPAIGGEIALATAYQHGVRLAAPTAAQRLHLPLTISVRDNGPGIPEDLRPHLFDPFVSTKTNGKGLGLALVAKIVADHGGLVECDSQPGRTIFRLHLPASSESEAEGAPDAPGPTMPVPGEGP
ncbi:MAG: PAS domain-containing protein [Alphaproteobacteria bacterium]|nr:PAS domain-containing protein [Alphaproteobacteria bacterium]